MTAQERTGPTGSDPFEYDDAAYVLGALSPDQVRAFEAHLPTCAACRARVTEVRGVPELLAGVTVDDLADDVADDQVPDTLLPGLLRRVDRRRRRQRWGFAAIGTVAAACLVALAVLVWPFGRSGGGSQPQARDFVAVASSPVRANASLVSRSWGTQIDVHCSYAVGVTRPFPYALRVIDDDGDPETLGSWSVPITGDIAYQAGTHYSLDEIRSVQIVTLDGTPILELKPN